MSRVSGSRTCYLLIKHSYPVVLWFQQLTPRRSHELVIARHNWISSPYLNWAWVRERESLGVKERFYVGASTLFIICLKVEVSCVLFFTQPVCLVPNQNTRNLYLQADDEWCMYLCHRAAAYFLIPTRTFWLIFFLSFDIRFCERDKHY